MIIPYSARPLVVFFSNFVVSMAEGFQVLVGGCVCVCKLEAVFLINVCATGVCEFTK